MKKLILLFLLVGVLGAESKHIELLKSPGDPVVIDFWDLPADTATFDGMALESAQRIQGPYSDVAMTLNKADRAASFPAPDTPTFYRLYWFKVVNGVKQKSASSNVVAVFITYTGLPTK
jgi:predicted Zn-dependent protease with MMP-like domain